MTQLFNSPAATPGARGTGVAISLRGVTKHFRDAAGRPFTAVDRVNLQVGQGEVVAFLGPNGAGKTTTVDMLLGLTKPDSGSVHLFGSEPLAAVQAGQVSAVLQTGGLLPDLTVGGTVAMMGALYDGADPARCLRRAGIANLADRKVGKCSGGEQQRLRFALALLPDPDLIVLDEPTAGMDVEARRQFWAAVREDAEHGLTVLFATHYLEEADQFADRIVLLDGGQVVADGSAASIRATVAGRTVSAVISQSEAEVICTVPGTRVSQRRGHRTFFEALDSDDLLRRLLTQTTATEVESTPRSLEDAFVQLTGRGHHTPSYAPSHPESETH